MAPNVWESNIKSLACPDALKRSLSNYTSGLIELLGDSLLGVYLYGSLACGCHRSETSDVDVIVVTRDGWPEPEADSILSIHLEVGVQVDAVFVTESQLLADVFPTPIGFLVKPISGYQIIRDPDGRRDFLLERQDAYEAGIALAGPPPSEAIRPVPWPLLAECLDFLFPHIIPNFKNSALMLCRIAYAWTHHKLCCKRTAGEWGIEAFDKRWNPMIKAALADYAGYPVDSGVATTTLCEFEKYCASYIDGLRA